MLYTLYSISLILNPKLLTVRAGEQKFGENVHPPTMCHMLHVTCHVSGVRCLVSGVTCHFFLLLFLDNGVELVGGGSVINRAYPV